MKRIHYTAQASDEGRLLREVISSRMDVSKRLMKRCKAHPEGILVNGERRTVRYVVHEGDDVSLIMAPELEGSDIIHEDLPLTVVYEDDMLLVVDKPPGVTMFPRRRGERGSLAGAVLAHLAKNGEADTFHPVSRLDIGTTGLVLLAKNSFAAGQLSRQRAKKYYQCFAFGQLRTPMHLNGDICDASEALRHAVGPLFYVGQGGKACRTIVQPLTYVDALRATACWVCIDTGRRHQIRVHLAHQGHPLVGDVTYGGPPIAAGRPLLHAAALCYQHPGDGRYMQHFLPMHRYGAEPEAINIEAFQKNYSEMG
uniref:RluA family pseudouridine synthase n=1 Tax=Gemmiger formicilis TaxID=745368 RepID=UPI004025C4AC